MELELALLGTRAPALVADALVRLGVETLRVDDASLKRIPPDVISILADYGVELLSGRGGTRETLQRTAENLAKMLRRENVATAAVEALTKLFIYSVDRFM